MTNRRPLDLGSVRPADALGDPDRPTGRGAPRDLEPRWEPAHRVVAAQDSRIPPSLDGGPSRSSALRPQPASPGRPSVLEQPRTTTTGTPSGSAVATGMLYGGVATLCLLVGGLAYMLAAAPVDMVRDRIIAEVRSRTGRDLRIAGATSLTLFPNLGIVMHDVTLAAPPAMSGPPTLTVQSIEVEVGFWPLLQSQLVVQRLVLRRPIVEARIDTKGRRSWDFAAIGVGPASPLAPRIQLAQVSGKADSKASDAPPVALSVAPPVAVPAKVGSSERGGLDGLALADVRIDGGIVRYRDERAGVAYEATGVDATMALADVASPMVVNGQFVWRGETVALSSHLASPRVLAHGQPAKLTASLSGRPGELRFDGVVTPGEQLGLDGKLALTSPSVKGVVAWLGGSVPTVTGLGPVTLAGRVQITDRSASIAEAALSLDGMTGNGQVAVDWRGNRPRVKADLRLAALDLDKYRVDPSASSPVPTGPATVPPITPVRPDAPRSIEDLIERTAPPSSPPASSSPKASPGVLPAAPKVRGFVQRTGWSTEAFDVSVLRLADGEARLVLAGLASRELKLGPTQVVMNLQAGVLKAEIVDTRLYDGQARGNLTVDATGAEPRFTLDMTAENVAAMPLLRDIAGIDLVSGQARLVVSLAAAGRSEKRLAESLAGTSKLTVRNGAVHGWDLSQIVRGVRQGQLALDRATGAKTEFSELVASSTITAGIAENGDMRVTGPAAGLSGAGRIDIGKRQLDYAVRARIAELGNLDVPLRVTGTWERPQYKADLIAAAASDPRATGEALRRLGRTHAPAIEEAVRRLTGKPRAEARGEVPPAATTGPDSTDERSRRSEETLRRLFGR